MVATSILAEFVSGLAYDSLPERVKKRACECLLDLLGAVLSGLPTESSRQGVQLVRLFGGLPQATVVGRALRTSAPLAALANGISAHAQDIDDAHRFATGFHPGATVIPAALAAAELAGSCTTEFLVALVAGYEVGGKVGRAINPSHRYRGFHSTGTVGCLAAAAAVARILHLTPRETASALGIAASQAGGLFAFLRGGAQTKHFHAGHAAYAGVVSGTLASLGFMGPSAVLEGEDGFCRAYADEFREEVLTRDLGSSFEIEQTYFKPHAACGHAFSAIDAALALRAGLPRSLDEVVQIRVRTYRAAAVLTNRRPSTPHGAKFSIPYCVAVALLRGRVSLAEFQPESLADKEVIRLASRTVVEEDPAMTQAFPTVRPAVVEIILSSGARMDARVDIPRGMPENPLSPEDLEAKFAASAGPVVGADRAARIQQLIRTLPEAESLNPLMSLLFERADAGGD